MLCSFLQLIWDLPGNGDERHPLPGFEKLRLLCDSPAGEIIQVRGLEMLTVRSLEQRGFLYDSF